MKIPTAASCGVSVKSVGIFNVYWVSSKQTRGAQRGGVSTQ
ncbi:MAG TPA: hypothetical protein VI934_04180 [Candidatus Nanoarchaeia archaeon]|nr:hypothetical protein [Candidatus Nanoarchaeia archaeon]